MANITKLNLYLNEEQYRKLCLVAESENKSPEEIANNAVYSYLSIVNPFAADDDDHETEEDQHEILFYIPDEAADQLLDHIQSEDYDDLDEYAKKLLLREL